MPEARRMRRRSACVLLLLFLGGCGSDTGTTTDLTALRAEVAFPHLSFENPVFITHAGDGSNRLFVVEQAGRIRVFPNDAAARADEVAVFLDRAAEVLSGGELGMLGLAFDPDYAANGFFYVNYTLDNPRRSRIARFRVSADPARAAPESETVLLEFEQPFANHNGGMLAFGPDGMLYVATGDGGSAGDPQNHAQRLDTVLGKILRIAPDGSIPPDNPFAGRPGARGEIWAYGLRNPWRMSFDRQTGTLWAGDVGQGAREEIDIIVRGGNYGWRVYEGTQPFANPANLPADAFLAPVLDYGRELGGSVVGGYVYRGTTLPALAGAYVYGDFLSGRIWALLYDAVAGAVARNVEVARVPGLSSFGQDAAGEIYVTSFDGRIYRLRAR
ncbi:MAG TPA: PQQ-dependent sugar dehydrogenase [Burkholderiales bacterium]